MFKDYYFFIKSLKTKNFKSFFGSVNFGPFHPKINAIIGPNGSGNSNFLEALMFTFGKKTMNLQSKKLGNLIYARGGTQALQMNCTVFMSVGPFTTSGYDHVRYNGGKSLELAWDGIGEFRC